MATAQYFIVQVVAAQAATRYHYSWRFNTISDLGNTMCGLFDGRYVCSPLHAAVDWSFVALGVTLVTGSWLIYQRYRGTRLARIGFSCVATAGLGGIIVGLSPENTIGTLHLFGTALVFLVGSVGILLVSFIKLVPRWLRWYSLVSAVVSLLALAVYITGDYFHLGGGTLERVISYPQALWLMVFGTYSLLRQKRHR
jgi:hypothetical membrane protein